MKNELLRKSIHLCSLMIPFGYKYWFHFDKRLALLWILAVFALFFAYEYLRRRECKIGNWLNVCFGKILREHEQQGKLAGSFYLLLASLICVYFFTGEVAFLSLSFLSLGDSLAALVGKRYGRIRLGKKSLEGSLACFTGCMFLVYFFANRALATQLYTFWLVCTAGALAATVAELVPTRVDDNLKMPIASALVMTAILAYGG